MKTKEMLLRQCLVGLFFVMWGMLWLSLYQENTFAKVLSSFFIILGIFMMIKTYSKWKRWKDSKIHTGGALTDERLDFNLLRASRAGFIFLYVSITVLFTLFGLKLINEIIFTALMGPVFAIASVLYVLSFYRYEKGVNENEN